MLAEPESLHLIPGDYRCEPFLVCVLSPDKGLVCWANPLPTEPISSSLKLVIFFFFFEELGSSGNSGRKLAGNGGRTRSPVSGVSKPWFGHSSIRGWQHSAPVLCRYHSVDANSVWGQSHFLYQGLEEIIKGHMQIRHCLEFLCLKSETSSLILSTFRITSVFLIKQMKPHFMNL